MEEFFCKVTPDGWMSFFGALLGASINFDFYFDCN